MKKWFIWLCILAMLMPASGLALEMNALPDTFQELMQALPENLCPAPEELEVVFNINDFTLLVYCPAENWPQATGRIGTIMPMGAQFTYDASQGAYVEGRASMIAIQTGSMGGVIALRTNTDASGWLRTFQLYFDNEAFENVLWPDAAQKAPALVTDFSSTNYTMPMITDQLPLDNGTLSVVHYADRTEAMILDSAGTVLTEQTYPDVMPFCSQFSVGLPQE